MVGTLHAWLVLTDQAPLVSRAVLDERDVPVEIYTVHGRTAAKAKDNTRTPSAVASTLLGVKCAEGVPTVVYQELVTLPAWAPPRVVRSGEMDAWMDWSAGVAVHELAHIRIMRAGAAIARRDVVGLSCEEAAHQVERVDDRAHHWSVDIHNVTRFGSPGELDIIVQERREKLLEEFPSGGR